MCQQHCKHSYFVISAHQLALLSCRRIALVGNASAMIYNANYTMDKVSQSVVGHLPLLMLSLPGSATSQPVCYTTNNVVGDIQGHSVEQEIMRLFPVRRRGSILSLQLITSSTFPKLQKYFMWFYPVQWRQMFNQSSIIFRTTL